VAAGAVDARDKVVFLARLFTQFGTPLVAKPSYASLLVSNNLPLAVCFCSL
jgi:hypothetical protein